MGNDIDDLRAVYGPYRGEDMGANAVLSLCDEVEQLRKVLLMRRTAVTADQALRFAAYEAEVCLDRDAHEALCLLMPALVSAAGLKPMEGYEAAAVRRELREWLASTPTHYKSPNTTNERPK